AFAIDLVQKNVFEFAAEFDEKNLIADSLFESFSKLENVEVLKNNTENGKKTYKFGTKNIKIDKILQDLKEFAI
ncbi:MAG: hypothetical protein J6T39_00640, partial [Clostridia bacterium]|nr:hypothetical protein [Clostridia bacterium]